MGRATTVTRATQNYQQKILPIELSPFYDVIDTFFRRRYFFAEIGSHYVWNRVAMELLKRVESDLQCLNGGDPCHC